MPVTICYFFLSKVIHVRFKFYILYFHIANGIMVFIPEILTYSLIDKIYL